MLAETLLAFALASLLIELTPGPNMTYLALVAAAEGRRLGFAAVAGVALGLLTIGLVAAFGVAEIIRSSDLLYELLRWAGVAFLLYLAWEGWMKGAEDAPLAAPSMAALFRRGLITNLLNPKAAVFYVTVLPAFTVPSSELLPQTLTLSLIYVSVATAVHAAIVLMASLVHPWLADPVWERRARRILSALLALVAIGFMWSTAR